MAITIEELERLIELAYSYIGRSIKLDESISRSREIGRHDRHFATHTWFKMTVENVIAAFSGAQLAFLGENGRYGISLDSVIDYNETAKGLEIIEHFEHETERLTIISILE